MTACFVAQIDWKGSDAFQRYVRGMSGMIERRGGRYVIASGDLTPAEGRWAPGRLVVLEFPTLEALREWYDSEEYRPLRDLRLQHARSDAVIVEGVEPR